MIVFIVQVGTGSTVDVSIAEFVERLLHELNNRRKIEQNMLKFTKFVSSALETHD